MSVLSVCLVHVQACGASSRCVLHAHVPLSGCESGCTFSCVMYEKKICMRVYMHVGIYVYMSVRMNVCVCMLVL